MSCWFVVVILVIIKTKMFIFSLNIVWPGIPVTFSPCFLVFVFFYFPSSLSLWASQPSSFILMFLSSATNFYFLLTVSLTYILPPIFSSQVLLCFLPYSFLSSVFASLSSLPFFWPCFLFCTVLSAFTSFLSEFIMLPVSTILRSKVHSVFDWIFTAVIKPCLAFYVLTNVWVLRNVW